MKNEDELKKAKFYALKAINFRPRSTEELTERLKNRGFLGETIKQVISEFTDSGLLDDTKFSRLWVNSRMASNPKGVTLLKRELKSKGMKRELIEKIIEETKKDYNEYEVVKRLADARMGQLKGLNQTTAKRRLFGFLKRRGFTFDTIMKVLEQEFKN
ncbi:MAG: regulatory protein RecX [Candidatus Omnitrophica bacterium]|nr:regulatory protein RecX [Candidatus Omnitrophota bacterium]